MATSTTKAKSKTSKSTTVKSPPATPRTLSAEAALKAAVQSVASSKPAGKSDPDVTQADLKKKELIDLVVESSGIKKKDAKPVVEAMLEVLGETIASGRELNLQPLGKLRINRAIDKSNGRVFVCKLRQSTATKSQTKFPAKDSLAGAMDKL